MLALPCVSKISAPAPAAEKHPAPPAAVATPAAVTFTVPLVPLGQAEPKRSDAPALCATAILVPVNKML